MSTVAATTTINHLPDLCLIIIFDHVPMEQFLLVLGRVCRRWRLLQPAAGFKRKTLSLAAGLGPFPHWNPSIYHGQSNSLNAAEFCDVFENPQTRNQWCHVSLPALSQALVEQLTTALPSIKQLVLIFDNVPTTCVPLVQYLFEQVSKILIAHAQLAISSRKVR